MTTLTPLLAADAPSAPDPAHQRAEVRNNMFVVAVLYGAGGSVPVRVRNMSRGGALVESADTPGEGQHVRLSRGSLSVRGHIAWQRTVGRRRKPSIRTKPSGTYSTVGTG